VAIDLGTGDGAAVLQRARREPTTLAIGVDPVASAMAETSARAARRADRGGLPNALFAVTSVEQLPPELANRADEVTVILPWGSLLDGIVGADPAVVGSMAALLRPGGRLEIVVSSVPRDGHRPLDAAGLAAAFRAFDVTSLETRAVTLPELRALGSTWAKRLRAGTPERPATRLRFRRTSR